MTGDALATALAALAALVVIAVPVTAVIANRRRALRSREWILTVVVFAVIVTGAARWLSPVVVEGVQCLPSVAVRGLVADRTELLAPGAVPLEARLACAAQSQRVVVGWGLVLGVALAVWGWFITASRRRTVADRP